MIEFRNIAVRFGTHEVLNSVNLRVNRSERVGITGPNGSGKSTLFRLIQGEALPDSGNVTIEESPHIGYIRQHLAPDSPDETLLEYALRGLPRLAELEEQIHSLEHTMGSTSDEAERTRLLRRIGELQSEFEHLGGYDIETRVKVSLGGLGFTPEQFDTPFTSFSGGWQMRAELSRVLAAKPDLLLLDEPSNYLDLPAVEWLQRFLKTYDGTLMLISHDRYLLRTLTTITIEVDANTATRYNGDLDFYLREREIRYANLLAAKENQDRRREQLERFVERFRATSSKAAQAQSRVKMIERIDEEAIVLPKRSLAAAALRLAPAPHSGAEVARIEDLTFGYHPDQPVLREVNLSISRGDKVAIVGYNGMGKTTLLRLIAGTCQPDSGTCQLGHKVEVGYLSQEFAETIPTDITLLECAKRARPTATERELRSHLAAFGFTADDIEKSAGVISGGERIRLAFLRLFLDPPNLMLLDEPTTHLDLEGRATLEQALQSYNGTVCLVSHDLEFVRNTATSIIEISPAGVTRYPGNYDYYLEKSTQDTTLSKLSLSCGGTSVSPLSARDQRRARAEERARHQPAIRALQARVDKNESRIIKLEQELEELSAILFNPTPETDFADTNRRLKHCQDRLELHTAEWERDASELEELKLMASAIVR